MKLLVRFDSRKTGLYDVLQLDEKEKQNTDNTTLGYIVIKRLWPQAFLTFLYPGFRVQKSERDGDYITDKYNSFEEFMEDNLELFL